MNNLYYLVLWVSLSLFLAAIVTSYSIMSVIGTAGAVIMLAIPAIIAVYAAYKLSASN